MLCLIEVQNLSISRRVSGEVLLGALEHFWIDRLFVALLLQVSSI